MKLVLSVSKENEEAKHKLIKNKTLSIDVLFGYLSENKGSTINMDKLRVFLKLKH